MRAKKFLAGVVAATILLTSALTVACGSEDAGDGLTRSDVEEIVREQTSSTPAPSGLTREEVEAVVQATLDGGPGKTSGALTLAEIRAIVQDELEALPQPEPGLTIQDVEEAISAAMDGAAPTAEALSIEEVEDAISAAMAGIPMAEPGVSAQEAEMIARSVLAAAPDRSAPDRYTQFFVDGAISRYESQGRQSAIDHYNSLASIDGQWYMIILDESGTVLAHYDEHLRGLNLNGPLGTDVNGYEFGPEMLSATASGKWVSYVYRNPEIGSTLSGDLGQLQLKNAWVVRHDDLLFVSGWHIDAEEFTKSLVRDAVDTYLANGLEETMRYYNSPASITAGLASTVAYYNNAADGEGKWVAFIADETGRIVGIQNPSMLGQQLEDVLGVEMIDASSEGGWITNGGTMRIWAVSQDGLTFGSGWYRR